MEDYYIAIVVGLFTVASIIINVLQNQKKRDVDRRLGQSEARLAQLRENAKITNVIDYKFVDVILFGPRASGKTSIVELWTSPWTQIDDSIMATSRWRKYETSIHEMESEHAATRCLTWTEPIYQRSGFVSTTTLARTVTGSKP